MNFWQKLKLNRIRKKVQRVHELREQRNKAEDIQNEIKLQYQLAEFYDKHRFDKKLPHAEIYALECYRINAALGDRKAQYICGQRLLEQGKFWDAWSRNPIYGATANKKYAANFYEEALAYLKMAEEGEYPLAKRLLGLIYVHGWGVPADMDKGFKLVLESIDQEQAWDRATKILEDLKLNSPAFFAALRSYKGQGS